jgi:molybdate transport system substrate-binding protein
MTSLSRFRAGRMPAAVSVVGAFAVLLGLGLLVVSRWDSGQQEAGGGPVAPVVLFCAASNRGVMEAILADYRRETGRDVVVQYGPSQTLLATLAIGGMADLYLPADDSYLAMARRQGLVDAGLPLAEMRAVVAVPRGNPAGVAGLDDLFAAGFRLAAANPDAAAIGAVTQRTLEATADWERFAAAVDVFTTTVNEVANAVKLGSADAGIVYDAVLRDYPDLEGIPLAVLEGVRSRVGLAVATATSRPQAAYHLARYIAAGDRGLVRYAEYGFTTLAGDTWEEQPELTLYAGSMLRPAIEETITAFEAREGVRVSRVYNGCGILVAQMESGRLPDAYFACDLEFMSQVQDRFPDSQQISQNELVILVPRGNPAGIRSLADLSQPGLRVGIGHEKQCAMGWLTQRTLTESGLRDDVMENVVVQTPTGDMLVNQMRSGSLDAAVVYLSNAAGAGDSLAAVRIQELPCSVASQPFGVAAASPRRRLAERLGERFRSPASQHIFEAEGFRWIASQKGPDGPHDDATANR